MPGLQSLRFVDMWFTCDVRTDDITGVRPLNGRIGQMDLHTLWIPLVICYMKMAIEIVRLPIENGAFSLAMLVYRRVYGVVILWYA